MAVAFRYPRRVQFHETDLAGIAHFSWYFRYMEEAEHALWRSLGMSVAPTDGAVGFPRVAASCDFKAPLRFEEEFEVVIQVEAVGRRSIRYACTLEKGAQIVAVGSMTSASVTRTADGRVTAVDLPEAIAARLR
ncbi:MAG: acyl-CoA thioesterase [Acidobacteria bacterium]|nr:acyl-CoA thioesterase [Acidobacteriota bacterium]